MPRKPTHMLSMHVPLQHHPPPPPSMPALQGSSHHREELEAESDLRAPGGRKDPGMFVEHAAGDAV
jgi:hypothetical protein